MVDWEGMILARQEAIEIWEEDPDAEYLQNPDVKELFGEEWYGDRGDDDGE